MSQRPENEESTSDAGDAIDIGDRVEESGVGTTVDDSPDLPNNSGTTKTTGDGEESRSSSDDTKESEQSEYDSDRSFIFLRRATSFSDFAALNDRSSIEARVARARGRDSYLDEQPDEDGVYHVEQSEGRVKTESGFVMHFVDKDALSLNGYDIVDTHQAYPVALETLETLPETLLGRLRDQDQVKITAEYDSDDQEFLSVSSGWDRSQSQIDELMEIAEKMDGNVVGAVYFMAMRESREWNRADRIAQLRDIEHDSVRRQVNSVEETVSNSTELGQSD